MNPESHAEVLGRLAALELVAAQGLAIGLAPLWNRADLVEELRVQYRAKLDRLPPELKEHAIAATDRLLFSALATGENFGK